MGLLLAISSIIKHYLAQHRRKCKNDKSKTSRNVTQLNQINDAIMQRDHLQITIHLK